MNITEDRVHTTLKVGPQRYEDQNIYKKGLEQVEKSDDGGFLDVSRIIRHLVIGPEKIRLNKDKSTFPLLRIWCRLKVKGNGRT